MGWGYDWMEQKIVDLGGEMFEWDRKMVGWVGDMVEWGG